MLLEIFKSQRKYVYYYYNYKNIETEMKYIIIHIFFEVQNLLWKRKEEREKNNFE